MSRNACVIQITPVRLSRTSTNDDSVVRKIYLSIDPIAYHTIPAPCDLGTACCDQTLKFLTLELKGPHRSRRLLSDRLNLSLPSLWSVTKMATPWHLQYMVDIKPLWPLS